MASGLHLSAHQAPHKTYGFNIEENITRRSVVTRSSRVNSPTSNHDPSVRQDINRRRLLHFGASIASSPLWFPKSAPATDVLERLPATSIPKEELAPGLGISRVVKGCWQLSGGHRGDSQTDRTGGKAALEDFQKFVDSGVTTFDTADHYGPSEVLIGKFIASGGQELRDKVQVLTKVCLFDDLDMLTVSNDSIKKEVAARTARLQTKPDLIQMYWGAYEIPKYVEAAQYLAESQARGEFGHIGVTNFDVKRVEAMVDKGGVPVRANQVQYSLLDRRPENGMLDYCQSHSIKLLPYGVVAGGLLSDKYLGKPASSVKLDTFSKKKYARVIAEVGGWSWFQTLLQQLDQVARKHDTSIANVATRWVLDKPAVAGAAVGARNPSHLNDYSTLFAFNLDQSDKDGIDEVLSKGKKPAGDCYQWERGLGPF